MGIYKSDLHKDTVAYGSKEIEFEIEWADRKTLAISVQPDLRVTVKAPKDAPISKIKEKVKKRGDWILSQRVYFSAFLPHLPPRQYISGETFWYLGRQYRLKIKDGQSKCVAVQGQYLEVISSKKDGTAFAEKAVAGWYRNQAIEYFQSKLDQWLEKLKNQLTGRPVLIVRKMNFRWGSFSKSGQIILNSELIQAPSHCIEYVIVHELCHLVHANHRCNFYQLLEKIMPDWKIRKDRLEKFRL